MRTNTLLATLATIVLLPLGAAAEQPFDYDYFDVTYMNNGMDGTVTAIDGRETIDLTIGADDGFGIRAGRALTPNVHVFAGYTGSNMDLTATHKVPFPTLGEMRDSFYTTPGDEYWDGYCDLNGDGEINAIDLGLLKLGGNRVASEAAVDGDMTTWRVGIGYNRLLTPRVGGFVQVFWDARDLDFGKAVFMGENRDFNANDDGFGATIGARGRVTERFELTGHVTYTPVGDVDMLAATGGDMIRDDTLFGLGGEFWLTEALRLTAEVEGDADVRTWTLGARYGYGGS